MVDTIEYEYGTQEHWKNSILEGWLQNQNITVSHLEIEADNGETCSCHNAFFCRNEQTPHSGGVEV
ncbi:hypothetical protein [Anabaena sp. CA = ATCC 33047]|uniref:hypothetical protein n=1 Tax=Anabaena sp. (strain CA / ATCC 33047) TaxID=52271 RepID=UPI0012EDCDAF|nr:hypothetical protein [Anabaena sp. CA = ATCC 33047]